MISKKLLVGDEKGESAGCSPHGSVLGFKQLFVCRNYFSKCSSAESIKDKSAATTAQLSYETKCRHGCMKVAKIYIT